MCEVYAKRQKSKPDLPEKERETKVVLVTDHFCEQQIILDCLMNG